MKNKRMINRALIFLAMACLLAGPAALAQNASDSNNQAAPTNGNSQAAPADNNNNTNTQTVPADSSAQAVSADSSTQAPADNPWYANSDGAYSVSLGTGQLISLYPQMRTDQSMSNGEYAEGAQPPSARRDYRYQFFYGGAVESFYTNNIGNTTPGVSNDLYSTAIEPYVALFMPTHTGRFLAQYSGVITPTDTLGGDAQAFHTITLSGMGSFNPRWFWGISTSGSYGSEAARLQGPLSFLVVSATPVADTTSDAVLLNANNVAFWQNRFSLGWLKSRRDRITFSAFHTYTGIQGDTADPLGSHANSIGAKLEYDRSLTQRIDMRTYGEADKVLTGPTCNTYGAGIGLGMRLSHSVVFDIAGGPQWSNANCGSPQSANFSASLVKNFGNRDRIYASVNRQFTTFATVDSRWEDNATVGFSKGISRVTLTTDAGYLRGTSITNVIPAYHG
ncbi:MAG TPA: hypothetical protein VJW55_02310, partial [Candidatus Angelobacter sp.]|nr:hypothetical protein [Candidatus Angelobacter sp.]